MSRLLEYTQDHESMRETVRSALARSGSIAAAREATLTAMAPSVWEVCQRLELPALLVPHERQGLGLGLTEAMVCIEELGRVLACHPLRGHWLAVLLLEAAGRVQADVDDGRRRACAVLARPPHGAEPWAMPASLAEPAAMPRIDLGPTGAVLTGEVSWVPDIVGADVLVVVARQESALVVATVEAAAVGVRIEPTVRYDATTNLGRVSFDHADVEVATVDEGTLRRVWAGSQAMRAADALGVARACLEMATAHAKVRYTFGRPIGSYQAVKHSLVEVLRLVENATTCSLWAGEAWAGEGDDIELAAAAARSSAGRAEELATRTAIFVHGGMGATWEHDAPYYYRRSQLSRLLLGGTAGGSESVGHLLMQRVSQDVAHV